MKLSTAPLATPFSFALLSLIFASPVFPATWHVPSQCPTIQAGVDSAAVGDTVLVACGTYTWTGEGTGDVNGLVRMKSAICLRSETGDPDCVTIDAESQGRVLYCSGLNASTRIEGLTLTHGFHPGGGGAYCNDADAAWADCVFTANTAQEGAGMLCVASSPTLSRCEFRGNGYSGSTPGSLYGGGLSCGSGASSPVLTECLFLGNFLEDWSGQSWPQGGAACFRPGTTPTLDRCVVVGNRLSAVMGVAFGNGLYFGDGAILTRCTIARNSGFGDAIWHDGSLQLTNTIVAFNEGAAIHCGYITPALACCDLFGNGSDWVGCIAGQSGVNGNLSADPLFCYVEGGDCSLRSNSPCLDVPGCGGIGALGVGCSPRNWHVALEGATSPETGRKGLPSGRSRTASITRSAAIPCSSPADSTRSRRSR